LPGLATAKTVVHGIESRISSEWKWIVSLLILNLAIKFTVFALSPASSGFQFTDFETWSDYAYAYFPSVLAFKSGFLPYVNFYYPYPPLFLYALTLFSCPGVSWGSAVPLVLADALTAIPVYLIARRFMSERASFLTSLVFVLAPLNLLYADYVWLNPPLTTLFLMSSLYCFLEARYNLSSPWGCRLVSSRRR
jgi:4-amino-4-deoxy-L-arabinose transferase-like glycosyltransferase